VKRATLGFILIAAVALAQEHENAATKTTLAFDAPPSDWKAHPAEKKPFIVDYDLPAAEGDKEGARVNVLSSSLGFDEYRKKVASTWSKKDGEPLTVEDQKSEEWQENGLKLRSLEQAGTHNQKGGEPKEGFALVCVHVRGAGGKWTIWLIGPTRSVAKNRESYLAWVKTLREVEAPKAEESEAVREVRFVHGAPEHGVPGPWALTAYRIGKDALKRFGVTRDRSWEIVVTHKAPKTVRYTCMLDGLLAATGCSPGKMNLVHETVEGEEQLETIIVHKPSGKKLVYKLTKTLRDKIRDVDQAGFPAAAKALDAMKDDEVFTVEETQQQK